MISHGDKLITIYDNIGHAFITALSMKKYGAIVSYNLEKERRFTYFILEDPI